MWQWLPTPSLALAIWVTIHAWLFLGWKTIQPFYLWRASVCSKAYKNNKSSWINSDFLFTHLNNKSSWINSDFLFTHLKGREGDHDATYAIQRNGREQQPWGFHCWPSKQQTRHNEHEPIINKKNNTKLIILTDSSHKFSTINVT